jgi:hypothetical protein
MFYSAQAHDYGSSAPDSYSRRGVKLTRDAAHMVIATLARDAHEHRSRGGAPNLAEADRQDALREKIADALAH